MIITQTMPNSHEDLVDELAHQQIDKGVIATTQQRTLKQADTDSSHFYSHALIGGNSTMLIAVTGLILCILVGYSYADNFSLAAQVASHIGLIIFATAVKIGYVMRCIGLDGMGHLQL